MPGMFDFVCSTCGGHVEHFFSTAPAEIPCEGEGCTGTMTRTFEPTIALRRPRRDAQAFQPVVFFEDASGNKRFPTSPDAPLPAGFERRELRTIHEVRAFERAVNQEERAKWDMHRSNEERAFDEQRRQRHAELRAEMAHFSEFGKDFARVAMERTNSSGRARSFDAGFRLEVFSENAGNRESYRDARTEWRSRRA